MPEAAALLASADLVKSKRPRVTGIDIEVGYVVRARRRCGGGIRLPIGRLVKV